LKIFFNFYKTKNKSNLKILTSEKNKKFLNSKYLHQNVSSILPASHVFNGLNVFLLNGKKLLLTNKLNTYLKFFFFFIFNQKNNSLFLHDTNNYVYLNEIKSSIKDNLFFKNPLNLLRWYLNYFSFMFNFKNQTKNFKKSNKKSNKNEKVDLNYKVVFVTKLKRSVFFFKWLKRLFFINYSTNFYKTFFNNLNDVFLNFKNSNLYKYKVLIYKNILDN
jgi:hypothetical protein